MPAALAEPRVFAAAREIAELVPMPRLLDALSFRVNERARRCACVLHGGSNPTAFSWREDGRWHCFSCLRGGDRIALVRAVKGCDFRQAVHFLAALAGIELSETKQVRVQLERARREREDLERAARVLADAEAATLREARETLWALQDLRRKASARLCAMQNGGPERWPTEAECAWEVLKTVCEQLQRADVAYCIAALSAPRDRATFALHPGGRAEMIERALWNGYVADAKGFRFEVRLQ